MAETTETLSFTHQEVVAISLKEILRSTCGLEVEESANNDQAAISNPTEPALIAIISLVGDVEWSMCLGFPKATAESLSEKFFGMPLEFDGPDLSDCVGEITNIFAGEIKGKLDERGVKANISLPSVIRGIAIKILMGHGSPYECKLFTFEDGKIIWYEVVAGKDALPTSKPGE